jgi:hypothetical protein
MDSHFRDFQLANCRHVVDPPVFHPCTEEYLMTDLHMLGPRVGSPFQVVEKPQFCGIFSISCWFLISSFCLLAIVSSSSLIWVDFSAGRSWMVLAMCDAS